MMVFDVILIGCDLIFMGPIVSLMCFNEIPMSFNFILDVSFNMTSNERSSVTTHVGLNVFTNAGLNMTGLI